MNKAVDDVAYELSELLGQHVSPVAADRIVDSLSKAIAERLEIKTEFISESTGKVIATLHTKDH